MTPRFRIMLVAGMVGCVSISPGAAHAEDGEQTGEQAAVPSATTEERGLDAAESDDAVVPSSPETSTAVDRAAKLYEAAHARYVGGDLVGALSAMEECYALSRSPELLFNLGQLNRELSRCRHAIAYYRQYTKQLPSGSRAEDATAAVEELATTCEAHRPRMSTPPPPAPAPASASPSAPLSDRSAPRARYWNPWRVAGWSSVVVGAGLGAGALYFAFRVDHFEDQLERTNEYDPALERSGQRSETAAQAMAAAAATAAIGGGLLLWFGSQDETPTRAVSIGVRSGGVHTHCSVRF